MKPTLLSQLFEFIGGINCNPNLLGNLLNLLGQCTPHEKYSFEKELQ
jgi:hypothetical protein